jgi:hypothetical protein
VKAVRDGKINASMHASVSTYYRVELLEKLLGSSTIWPWIMFCEEFDEKADFVICKWGWHDRSKEMKTSNFALDL